MKRFLKYLILSAVLTATTASAQWLDPTVALQTDIDSLRWAVGDSGTVAAGVAASLDSLGIVDTVGYDDPYANRKLIGVGAGIEGYIFTSGIVPATGCNKIGVMYYLGPDGSFRETMPSARNVWCIPMGRCVDYGYIDLEPGLARRIK